MSRQIDRDNRASQMNPNNDAYWQARGLDCRPEDWEVRFAKDEESQKQRTQVNQQSKK